MDKKDIKILVADSSFTSRRIICNQLIFIGISDSNIEFAEDAFATTFKQKQFNPDVITIDINMPDKTGLQVLSKLLSYDKKPFIVMISSESKKPIVMRAIQMGATQYIVKPFKSDVFSDKMNKIFDMVQRRK